MLDLLVASIWLQCYAVLCWCAVKQAWQKRDHIWNLFHAILVLDFYTQSGENFVCMITDRKRYTKEMENNLKDPKIFQFVLAFSCAFNCLWVFGFTVASLRSDAFFLFLDYISGEPYELYLLVGGWLYLQWEMQRERGDRLRRPYPCPPATQNTKPQKQAEQASNNKPAEPNSDLNSDGNSVWEDIPIFKETEESLGKAGTELYRALLTEYPLNLIFGAGVAILEELCFRGWTFFPDYKDSILLAFVSSILFAWSHQSAKWKWTFLYGLVSAKVAAEHGLFVTCFLHSLWNVALMLRVANRGRFDAQALLGAVVLYSIMYC